MNATAGPEAGRRLLIHHVDYLARTQPEKVFASFPNSVDFSKGFRNVDWKQFANSINRAAFWLEKTLGGKGRSSKETIAYIGAADIRYFILILAANKAGYKLLVASPRNSLEGQLNLLDKTGCTRFIRSEKVSLDDILVHRPSIAVHVVPDLDALLDASPVPHYSFNHTFEEVHLEPYVVYHSSGSTGLPKPIPSPHGAACTLDALHGVPLLDGKPTLYAEFARICPRIFICLPFFHVAGMIIGLCQSVYFGSTCVWTHPDRPLSPDVMDEIIEYGQIDGMVSAPSILDETSKSETSLDRLSRLKMVLVGTGPLPSSAGKRVSKKVFLVNTAGSTEAYHWINHIPDPEDWQYIMINEDAAGIEMRFDADRNLYEMVYVRRPDRAELQAIFKTFPDRQEFATGDMCEPHPSKPHLWRIIGRRDDMIVLSNGENVQPGPLQDLLATHLAVREALVVGQGRFQIAAILELRQYPASMQEAEQLMDEIWPSIEEANRASPTHARLLRQFVRFADPNKPFVRVGKGSISKPPTIALYAPEIDELYRLAEGSVATKLEPIDATDQSTLRKTLLSGLKELLGPALDNGDTDFFLAGADSITAMTMAASLKKNLQSQFPAQADSISSRLIYANPTVNSLSSTLMSMMKGGISAHVVANDQGFDAMISRSLAILPSAPCTVLLTGSTGSLGTYILDQLLTDTSVKKIYCLNRSQDSKTRQMDSARDRGLKTDFSKAVFLTANLAQPELGIDSRSYRIMANEVTHVIHAQWAVNWNIGLSTFEPQIQGVARLAVFSRDSPNRPRISFCSSIAAVQNWQGLHELEQVPETSLSETKFASSGYGLSKLAATIVLERVASLGVKSTILRIGQIAGPVGFGPRYLWPKQEWLPSLIASSRFLGLIPASLAGADTVDWIPVDRAAKSICEIALSNEALDDLQYSHIISPQATTWQETILPTILKHYQHSMSVVPLQEWVSKLKQSGVGASATDSQRNPAVKLLDFYEGLAGGHGTPHLATAQSIGLSPTLKSCVAVRSEDMEHWLAEWAF